MKTRLQECLLSPSPRAGTTRHNNSHPCRSPCGAFHWEEHLFTKIIPTCWGLDLLIDSLCMHLLCFLIYFLRWVCWTQTNAKGLGWPLPAIRVSSCAIPACQGTRQGSSPAEKQLCRPIVRCEDPSVELGMGQHSQQRSIRGNKFFLWKMPN